MQNSKHIIKIEHDGMSFKLINLGERTITIDYSNDVDFTDMVNVLAFLMDRGKSLEYAPVPECDEKAKVVLETLVKILDAYNEVVSQEDQSDVGAIDSNEVSSDL